MTRPRKELVCVDETPFYHVVSRCVRQTFLCGKDRNTGKCYEHRRRWIENRIRLLSSIFGIDILAYAVMSNHMHIVVKLSPESIEALSDREIIGRWCNLFKGPLLLKQWLDGLSLSEAQLRTVAEIILEYRRRLSDLGWFMKCLNEPIARQANREDKCTGHFWESRYKSKALLDEQALLSCMAYVDLNPIRANMAKTLSTADYTSIKERINPQFDLDSAVSEQIELKALLKFDQTIKPLGQFADKGLGKEQRGIPFSFKCYLELLDCTGRCVRGDKPGFIPARARSILDSLDLLFEDWVADTMQFKAKPAKNNFNLTSRPQ